jgi:hypothetical protein
LANIPAHAADLHVLIGNQGTPTFFNDIVGTDILWNAGYFGSGVVIANVEAGHPWAGHEVFDRTALGIAQTPALQINAPASETAPELGEVDFHATMVAHILVGAKTITNPDGSLDVTLAGIGMAPLATLWSGAIATTFDKTLENAGSFEISDESFRTPYVAFFTGTPHGSADVINSSWGFTDASGTAPETRTLTGLAAQNPNVAAVFSAGNSGPSTAVSAPASSPNLISVGALGGDRWFTPSSFSSGAPADFYNPATDTTIPGIRAAVHLAAPGENFALAAYLQPTGGLEPILNDAGINNPATDLYFSFNQSGTSFAAPVVSGSIALLKNIARSGVYSLPQDSAYDTRVLRSVLMASATRTEGWNNGQAPGPDGALITTQGLDFRTGAGALNVGQAALLYALGTADVPGTGGGIGLAPSGWDRGSVTLGNHNAYNIDLTGVTSPSELTVSLNWFVSDTFNTVDGTVAYGSFADLDLEIWSVSLGENPATLLAASRTLYNTSEFLRIGISPGTFFDLRVRFAGVVYDFDASSAGGVVYGLAWATTSIPEPATYATLSGLGVALLALRRRPRSTASATLA